MSNYDHYLEEGRSHSTSLHLDGYFGVQSMVLDARDVVMQIREQSVRDEVYRRTQRELEVLIIIIIYYNIILYIIRYSVTIS